MTLVEFLLVRIADDEQAATAAAEWSCEVCGSDQVHGCSGLGGNARNYADPRRVLAECEAKRRIIDMHAGDERLRESMARTPNWAGYCQVCEDGPGRERDEIDHMQLPCPTRALALPYADHPDYREEWRPC